MAAEMDEIRQEQIAKKLLMMACFDLHSCLCETGHALQLLHCRIIKLIIDKNPDTIANMDSKGNTALHVACMKNSVRDTHLA